MSKLKKYAVVWLPPLLLIIGLIFQDVLIPIAQWLADHIVFCVFYQTTGCYCLGCGGTRSLMALLHGDVLRSIHNNPAVIVLAMTAVLLYAEKAAAAFGKKLKLVPRSFVFWGILFVLQCIWNITRHFIPAMLPIS